MIGTQQGKTVYALASGKGIAGVSIIRVSGERARYASHVLTGLKCIPRKVHLADIRKADTGDLIDRGLVIWFPQPESFTGEDVVEFHVHGSPAIIQAMFKELAGIPETEEAGPGVFTRRAFLNGKMDLAQIEALSDLLNAESEYQRQQAIKHYSGYGSRNFKKWREDLKECLACLEVCIDFSEEDIDEDLEQNIQNKVENVIAEMENSISAAVNGERLRNGFRIVLAGNVNVGKSTLINTLANRDIAIVSRHPGTTRDLLEVHLDLKGIPVILTDTAGLRETDEAIESEGIHRAVEMIEQADIVLEIKDGFSSVTKKEYAKVLKKKGAVTVWNKIDLNSVAEFEKGLKISAKTGQGLEELLDFLHEKLKNEAGRGLDAIVHRERHKQAMKDCVQELLNFKRHGEEQLDLKAESLRQAIYHIGKIVGDVGVEEILDMIFSEFCIGK